jgi:hypothetical protein
VCQHDGRSGVRVSLANCATVVGPATIETISCIDPTRNFLEADVALLWYCGIVVSGEVSWNEVAGRHGKTI